MLLPPINMYLSVEMNSREECKWFEVEMKVSFTAAGQEVRCKQPLFSWSYQNII